MTRPQIIAYLNALEQSHDVNAMRLGDASIWPLLRVKIGEYMLRNEEPGGRVDVELRGSKTVRILRVAEGLIKGLWSRATLSHADLLFQSLQGHKMVLHDVPYDRFVDPLLGEAHAIGLRSVVFEHSQGFVGRVKRNNMAAFFDLTPQLAAAAVLHWRKAQPAVGDVWNLKDLLSQLDADGHGMNEAFLRNQLHTFMFYRQQQYPLLRRVRPQCVFVVCWYSAENMAVLHECRELGIRTVDLQHGVQGPAHLAYGTWSVIPSTGYSVMPDVFWCWDGHSVQNIDRWSVGTPHRALHLGDPFMESAAGLPPDPRWCSDGRKHVLYAVQPLNDVVPPSVVQAIKATRGEAHWIIRTHPHWKQTIPAVAALLRHEGLDREVLIDDGSITPLAPLLGSSDLHVTDFSSVIIEAAALGIPSAAVHPHAGDVFPDQLANGALTMTLTGDELVRFIRAPQRELPTADLLPPLSVRLQQAIGT